MTIRFIGWGSGEWVPEWFLLDDVQAQMEVGLRRVGS
jgi:hypothetical protein